MPSESSSLTVCVATSCPKDVLSVGSIVTRYHQDNPGSLCVWVRTTWTAPNCQGSKWVGYVQLQTRRVGRGDLWDVVWTHDEDGCVFTLDGVEAPYHTKLPAKNVNYLKFDCISSSQARATRRLSLRLSMSCEVFFRLGSNDDDDVIGEVILQATGYGASPDAIRETKMSADCRILAIDMSTRMIVGFVAMQISQGWVNFLACRPAFQGIGLGTVLMRLGVGALRMAGTQTVGLTPIDTRAKSFYRKLGFAPSQNRSRRRGGKLSDDDMWLCLSSEESHFGPNKSRLADFLPELAQCARFSTICRTATPGAETSLG